MIKNEFENVFYKLYSCIEHCLKLASENGAVRLKEALTLKELIDSCKDEYDKLSGIEISEFSECIYIIVEDNYGMNTVESYKSKKELIERIQSGNIFGKWKLMKEIKINV